MRSIILVTSLACLTAAGATAAAPWAGAASAGSKCANDPLAHLARPGKDAQVKKLTDLPPGETYLAVYRRDADGCIVPVKATVRRSPAQPRR